MAHNKQANYYQTNKQQGIMKKQFTIKPAQLVKVITKAAAKAESTNLLKFLADDGPVCCSDWDLSRMVITR